MSSLNNRLERLERTVKPTIRQPAQIGRWIFIDQNQYATNEAFEAAAWSAIDSGIRVIQVIRPADQ